MRIENRVVWRRGGEGEAEEREEINRFQMAYLVIDYHNFGGLGEKGVRQIDLIDGVSATPTSASTEAPRERRVKSRLVRHRATDGSVNGDRQGEGEKAPRAPRQK